MRLRSVTYNEVRVGDKLILDGAIRVVVTKSSVYINNSHYNRETGFSVRPVMGGRARPVAVHRLAKEIGEEG
jgi:hypothetical protein